MKKVIKLDKLTLINFKGIKNLTVDFQEKETFIYGENSTGKTTIFDSFLWLLFGKDSTDRKDFEIKTLDHNNRVIPKIDHEVSAVITVDGEEISIRRVLKEKWVKTKGSLEAEFQGNQTDYYWNDVPVTQTDFKRKVDNILDEQVFKLITNPFAFNSLKWQDRREVLMQIAGNVSDEELASGNSDYENLIKQLSGDKTLEDYKKQIAASVKKAKDDLKVIPTRIDEVERSKPEPQDFEAINKQLSTKQTELSKVDEKLNDANKAFQAKLDDVKEVRIAANELSSEINIIEVNARKEAQKRLTPDTSELDNLTKKLAEKKAQITEYRNAYTTLSGKKESFSTKIESLEKQMSDKRKEWETENAKELTFNDDDFHCPTCRREFESGDVETKKAEMLQIFKDKKAGTLNRITQEGVSLKTEKENTEKELAEVIERMENGIKSINIFQEELDKLEKEIDAYNAKQSNTSDVSEDEIIESILKADKDYASKKAELEKLQSKIKEVPSPDNSELISQRQNLLTEIDELKSKLNAEVQIQNADARIAELLKEEKMLAQQQADIEKTQFTIENFIKHKIDHLEAVINNKFKLVKFKMFTEQINGGIAETCEALVNGVPFSDVNTAGRINAGIDIINTLSDFYGISAVIFLDNRESCIEIIDTDSQVVNLIVSESDKKLRVESGKVKAEKAA